MTSESQARSLLGVAPDADDAAIRRAYRRLARRCHPDTGGDPAEFHRLQQAVAVLLAPRPPAPKPAASPSTSRMTRPSTATRMGATGWGESAGPQWHEGEVDLQVVDWGRPLPDPPHAWGHDLVAIAVAAETDDGAPVPHLSGVSRRPGSRLNRLAVWLSSDLLARWEVRPARDRGIAGHDVELRIHLSAVRARRRADEADWPLGWTRERRPSLTVVSQVLRPSPDRRATALRTADQLAAGLDALDWPLEDWHRPATP